MVDDDVTCAPPQQETCGATGATADATTMKQADVSVGGPLDALPHRAPRGGSASNGPRTNPARGRKSASVRASAAYHQRLGTSVEAPMAAS